MKVLLILLQALNNTNTQINIWAIIACFAAIISALSAFRSSFIAKRVYRLALKTYSDRQSNFKLYLVESYRWLDKKNKRKFLLFHITITNNSDSKNSYNAKLEIEYIRTDESVARAVFNHNEDLHLEIPQKKFATFNNDIRIDEKGMQSKWLIFEQPTTIFNDYRIAKYNIKIADTVGNLQEVESFIINEINSDEKSDKS